MATIKGFQHPTSRTRHSNAVLHVPLLMNPIPVRTLMAVVGDYLGLGLTRVEGTDNTIFQVDALVVPPDGGPARERVNMEDLVIEIWMPARMAAVQDDFSEVSSVAVLDVQALAAILRPPKLAVIGTSEGRLVEVEHLVLRVVAGKDLHLVEVLATATRNIHARVRLACPSDLKAVRWSWRRWRWRWRRCRAWRREHGPLLAHSLEVFAASTSQQTLFLAITSFSAHPPALIATADHLAGALGRRPWSWCRCRRRGWLINASHLEGSEPCLALQSLAAPCRTASMRAA